MKKLYVVDDSEVNLFLIQGIFDRDDSIDVIIENDSTRALDFIKINKPDVVVLDLMMPEVDGFQLLQDIKLDDEINKIPILVISARVDDEAYERVMEYGADVYLRKPIIIDDVKNHVIEMLSIHK